MSGEEAVQLYEPVVGFRSWVLHPDGGLGAISRALDFTWPAGEFQARCLGSPEGSCGASPGADCSCGIYAWHSRPKRRRPAPDDQRIAGAVLAWGEIEVADRGFRAEWARPVVLCIDPAWPADRLRAAHLAAHRYGAVMTTAEHLDTLACEHGAPVPRDERPIDPLAEAIYHLASGRPSSSNWDWATTLQTTLGSDRPAESALFADSIDLLLREARVRWTQGSSLGALLQAGASGLLHACRFHGREPWMFRPVALWWIERGMHWLADEPSEEFTHRVYRWRELHAALRGRGPDELELRALRPRAATTAEPEELRLTPLEFRVLGEEATRVTGVNRATLAGHLYLWAKRSGVISET